MRKLLLLILVFIIFIGYSLYAVRNLSPRSANEYGHDESNHTLITLLNNSLLFNILTSVNKDIGNILLQVAVQTRDVKQVKYIIKKSGNPNYVCTGTSSFKLIYYLLRIDYLCQISPMDSNFIQANISAQNKSEVYSKRHLSNREIVKALVNGGGSLTNSNHVFEDSNWPLLAVRTGDYELLKYFVKNGLDLNHPFFQKKLIKEAYNYKILAEYYNVFNHTEEKYKNNMENIITLLKDSDLSDGMDVKKQEMINVLSNQILPNIDIVVFKVREKVFDGILTIFTDILRAKSPRELEESERKVFYLKETYLLEKLKN